MGRTMACLVGIALFATSCGCASYANMVNDQKVYGGVQTDAGLVGCGAAAALGVWEPGHDYAPSLFAALGVLAVLDLPISAVADTVTLPFTILNSVGPEGGIHLYGEHHQASREDLASTLQNTARTDTGVNTPPPLPTPWGVPAGITP